MQLTLLRKFTEPASVLRSLGFDVRGDFCRTLGDGNHAATFEHIEPHGLLCLYNGRALFPGLWGYRPSFLREQSHYHLTARIETVFEKPIFRGPVRNSRCVVPLDSYLVRAPKRPSLAAQIVGRPSGSPWLWAGVYTDNLDGNPTVALLTRPATPTMADLGDRMPVAFDHAHAANRWLSNGNADACLEWLQQTMA